MKKVQENQLIELGRGEDANPVPANASVDNIGGQATLAANTRWKLQEINVNVNPDGGGESCDFEIINVADGFSFYTLHAPAAGPIHRESKSQRGLGLMIEVGATPIVVQLRATNRASGGGSLGANGFAALEYCVPDYMTLTTPLTARVTA